MVALRIRRFTYCLISGLAILAWYTNGPQLIHRDGDKSQVHHFSKPPLVGNPPPGLPSIDKPMVGAQEPPNRDMDVSRAPEAVFEQKLKESEPNPQKDSEIFRLPNEESMAEAVERLMQTVPTEQAAHNRRNLLNLIECIYDTLCTRQPQLVIFVTAQLSRVGETPGREPSIIHAFNNLDVSYVHSARNLDFALSVYRLFSTQVRAVIFDGTEFEACLTDIQKCIRSSENLDGIPVWKMFSLLGSFPDARPAPPLGFAWTLATEMGRRGETYLGYSIEKTCRETPPFIESANRMDRVFLLANLETYMWPTHNVWPPEYFEDVGAQTGAQFVASLDPVVGRLSAYPKAKGIHATPFNLVEIGGLPPDRVLEEVSKSRLLLGLFDPREMTVVFEALCLGVPFLNPIRSWDHSNPNDTYKWETQNTDLNNLGPPYVYNVFAKDYDGFKRAIVDAVTHPIESYIPEHMTEVAVENRIADFLARDWRMEAQAVLDSRKASGQPEAFLI
ncbi:hypothetical protein DFH07DRAFT_895489 [Mycena maculata]|uniref:Uncharacterized protein n=1 Tax=Mycena maculata TaxID=230809 RepID=A0AAD7HY15_9AGAR|nr:hypothetical protein DFH07DRAFT_895489 [Mycena maculata]